MKNIIEYEKSMPYKVIIKRECSAFGRIPDCHFSIVIVKDKKTKAFEGIIQDKPVMDMIEQYTPYVNYEKFEVAVNSRTGLAEYGNSSIGNSKPFASITPKEETIIKKYALTLDGCLLKTSFERQAFASGYEVSKKELKNMFDYSTGWHERHKRLLQEARYLEVTYQLKGHSINSLLKENGTTANN